MASCWAQLSQGAGQQGNGLPASANTTNTPQHESQDDPTLPYRQCAMTAFFKQAAGWLVV